MLVYILQIFSRFMMVCVLRLVKYFLKDSYYFNINTYVFMLFLAQNKLTFDVF